MRPSLSCKYRCPTSAIPSPSTAHIQAQLVERGQLVSNFWSTNDNSGSTLSCVVQAPGPSRLPSIFEAGSSPFQLHTRAYCCSREQDQLPCGEQKPPQLRVARPAHAVGALFLFTEVSICFILR